MLEKMKAIVSKHKAEIKTGLIVGSMAGMAASIVLFAKALNSQIEINESLESESRELYLSLLANEEAAEKASSLAGERGQAFIDVVKGNRQMLNSILKDDGKILAYVSSFLTEQEDGTIGDYGFDYVPDNLHENEAILETLLKTDAELYDAVQSIRKEGTA